MSRLKEREESSVQVGIGVVFLAVTAMFSVFASPFAAWPFLIPAAALLSGPVAEAVRRRRSLPKSPSKEGQLLAALHRNKAGMDPAEVALETSLTVTEADEMLSDLAGKGHLLVESGDGALFYRLPSRREERKLEG